MSDITNLAVPAGVLPTLECARGNRWSLHDRGLRDHGRSEVSMNKVVLLGGAAALGALCPINEPRRRRGGGRVI